MKEPEKRESYEAKRNQNHDNKFARVLKGMMFQYANNQSNRCLTYPPSELSKSAPRKE